MKPLLPVQVLWQHDRPQPWHSSKPVRDTWCHVSIQCTAAEVDGVERGESADGPHVGGVTSFTAPQERSSWRRLEREGGGGEGRGDRERWVWRVGKKEPQSDGDFAFRFPPTP